MRKKKNTKSLLEGDVAFVMVWMLKQKMKNRFKYNASHTHNGSMTDTKIDSCLTKFAKTA